MSQGTGYQGSKGLSAGRFGQIGDVHGGQSFSWNRLDGIGCGCGLYYQIFGFEQIYMFMIYNFEDWRPAIINLYC